MVKKTQSIVPKRSRRTRFEITHSIYVPSEEIPSGGPKDNIEIVDADGNIVTRPRDFSHPEDYRDYTIEALSETNPAMLAPDQFCTLSGGTPIESAEKAASYLVGVGSRADVMLQKEAEEIIKNTSSVVETSKTVESNE